MQRGRRCNHVAAAPVSQREVNTRGRRLLAQHRFRFCLFTVFSQAISGFQHLIVLQSINQLLNIAVPLPARQAVDMRQRRSVLVVTGGTARKRKPAPGRSASAAPDCALTYRPGCVVRPARDPAKVGK